MFVSERGVSLSNNMPLVSLNCVFFIVMNCLFKSRHFIELSLNIELSMFLAFFLLKYLSSKANNTKLSITIILLKKQWHFLN